MKNYRSYWYAFMILIGLGSYGYQVWNRPADRLDLMFFWGVFVIMVTAMYLKPISKE